MAAPVAAIWDSVQGAARSEAASSRYGATTREMKKTTFLRVAGEERGEVEVLGDPPLERHDDEGVVLVGEDILVALDELLQPGHIGLGLVRGVTLVGHQAVDAAG